MISQIIIVIAAAGITGGVGWIMRQLWRQGTDLALIREQLAPAGRPAITQVMADHDRQITILTQRMNDLHPQEAHA